MSICPRCGVNPSRPTHRYCLACHAANMREWRRTHPLNAEQRWKDTCRSYALTYKNRGLLIQQPCEECGDDATQMHHPNYLQPLLVEWLCRACHLLLHKELSRNVSQKSERHFTS
jgi:hypothetical protein